MDRANGGSNPGLGTRAERFDNERRRIIESCFSKTDTDGSLLETYITHIRVLEYATHPSSPPPLAARSPENEKPRVVIVSVRKNGRVRMHKSKENVNGTFSIGKTWNLDDLTQINSYTGPNVSPEEREWAGESGLSVIVSRPYYWQAPSDREKKFFVASLVKIFAKYTGGRTPKLEGFSTQEQDQVLGGTLSRSQVQGSGSQQQQPHAHSSPFSTSSQPPAPSNPSYPSNSLPPVRAPSRNGATSPVDNIDSVRSQQLFATRRTAGSNRSQDSVGNPPFGALQEERPPERRRPPMDPSRPQGILDKGLVPDPLMNLHSRRDRDRDPTGPPRGPDRTESGRESTEPRSENNSTSSLRNAAATTLQSGERVRSSSPELEDNRPGMGPMIRAKTRKVDASTSLWKTATVPSAFMPRPGGAGERLRLAQNRGNESDGTTSSTATATRATATATATTTTVVVPPSSRSPPVLSPDPPPSPIPIPVVSPSQSQDSDFPPNEADGDPMAVPPDVELDGQNGKSGPSAVVGNDAKYLDTLGVDSHLLDKRSDEFAQWLDFFGWVPGERMRAASLEAVRLELERELNKSQAGGWLTSFRNGDERVGVMNKGLDLAVAECEELDNLLTLYGVELSTLSDDIAYIEAQGQGLQVQAANQKLLKRELESLLEMCAITEADLNMLRVGRLGKMSDLEAIEESLVTLFKAMTKMNPSISVGAGDRTKRNDMSLGSDHPSSGLVGDYGQMRIVQEKKELYQQESTYFLRRLIEHMQAQFEKGCEETRRAMESALSRKVDPRHHDVGRELLWTYHPLMLYAREVDLDAWDRLLQIYQGKIGPMYKTEFRDVVDMWKRNVKQAGGSGGGSGGGGDADLSESLLLFTSPVGKQSEGLTLAAARKLTVKKSQSVLARGFRAPLHDGASKAGLVDRGGGTAILAYEALSGTVDTVLPLVETEQNFVLDFFHASTVEQTDFADCVLANRPHDRARVAANNFSLAARGRPVEPDRELARRVTRAMEAIFGFLEQDLQALVDWVIASHPLQGVGVLAVLDAKMADYDRLNQDFLTAMLQKLHGQLEEQFVRFVDQQIRAIEETKVQINKRKGVISSVRVFPVFSAAVENMMDGVDGRLGVRRTVDDEYDRILKAIFTKLKTLARDGSGLAGSGSGAGTGAPVAAATDAEDKEAINYHILMIENMHHLVEETDARRLRVLAKWRQAAGSKMAEHLALYLAAVMRRPLGKLLDYVENIEAQLQSGKAGSAVAAQPSNSKTVFHKILGQYDGREIRKGIEALRKRVEKHFAAVAPAPEPDSSLAVPSLAAAPSPLPAAGATVPSQALVARVLRDCERFYGDVDRRIVAVTTTVYGGDSTFEWPRAEVKNGFAVTAGVTTTAGSRFL